MDSGIKILKKMDIVLIVAFILLAIGLIFIFTWTAGDAAYVRVSVNHNVSFFNMAQYDGQEIVIESARGGSNTILIEGDRVRMIHADCPDQLCMRRGAISETWHDITCLPNQLVVTLEGLQNNSGYDGIRIDVRGGH